MHFRSMYKRPAMGLIIFVIMVSAVFSKDVYAKNTKVNIPSNRVVTIEELRVLFPAGAFWNHSESEEEYTPYQISDEPCSHDIKNPADTCNRFTLVHFGGGKSNGYQCAGFAYMLAYLNKFGTGVDTEKVVADPVPYVRDIEAGDILRMESSNGGMHSVYVIDRTDNIIKVAEANFGKSCKIYWDREIDLDKINLYGVESILRLTLKSESDSFDENGKGYFWSSNEKFAVKDTNGTVYRLYNKKTGAHIYTPLFNEVQYCLSKGWTLEESIGMSADSDGIPVYKLINKVTGEVLYSTSELEKEALVKGSWICDNEGKPYFYSGKDGDNKVYRLFNSKRNPIACHHYTSDLSEIKVLVNSGNWTLDNNGVPIFRLY